MLIKKLFLNTFYIAYRYTYNAFNTLTGRRQKKLTPFHSCVEVLIEELYLKTLSDILDWPLITLENNHKMFYTQPWCIILDSDKTECFKWNLTSIWYKVSFCSLQMALKINWNVVSCFSRINETSWFIYIIISITNISVRCETGWYPLQNCSYLDAFPKF